MKVLLLGGTGAMGVHLASLLNENKIDTFVTEADSLKGITEEFDNLLNNLSIDYIERRGSNWVYYNSKNELIYLCDNTTLKNKLGLTKLYNCIEF